MPNAEIEQSLGVVDEHLVRHAPEVPGGALQFEQPGRLAFMRAQQHVSRCNSPAVVTDEQ